MTRAILAIVLGVLSTGWAEPQTDDRGVVYGVVWNGTRQNPAGEPTPLANHEVVLHKYVDGQADPNPRAHTTTDARGRFEFTGLEVGERFAYYPVAVLDGIEYYGALVTVTPDTAKRRSDVHVFETTLSDSSIALAMEHILVEPMAGKLQVKEILVFTNKGRRTVVGSIPSGQPGKNVVLRLEVPQQAIEVQFGGDLMACCAVVNGNQIYDTMEFKPGVRREVLSYLLPYTGKQATLVKKMDYAVAGMDVFLPKGSGTLNAPGFESQGDFQIRGQRFERYTATGLAQGTVLTLTFAQLPAAPRDWRWLPPVALALLLLVGFGMRRRLKSEAVPPQSAPEPGEAEGVEGEETEPAHQHERDRLLDAILQLERAYETGSIEEATYLDARSRLEELILELDARANGNEPEHEASQKRESKK